MTLKLKIAPRSTLQLKTLPRLVAGLNAGNGISISSSGLNYTFSLDYTAFNEVTDPPNPTTTFVGVYDSTTNFYNKISFPNFVSSISGLVGTPLTRVNDTNVTLTLGGSPTTALLTAASITVGWSGTLAISRGGTGASTPSGAATNLGLGGIGDKLNLTISASVSSNALTIALKGTDGNDPSSSNPIVIGFRDSTLSSGDYTTLAITAATSLTISSGSTLGTSNNTAFRIWIVGFNDGGTFRLGAINCYSSGVISPLPEWSLKSSTAEGGAGAADSAGVIYTGTAVSSKAFRILGFLSYESGLSTAGTWASVPTVVQVFGPGVPKPGDIIQTAGVTDTSNTNTTSSSWTSSSVVVGLTPVSKCNPIAVSYCTNVKVNADNIFAFVGVTRGGTLVGVASAALAGTSGGTITGIVSASSGAVLDFPQSTSVTSWTLAFRNFDNATSVNLGSFSQSDYGSTMSATEIMA